MLDSLSRLGLEVKYLDPAADFYGDTLALTELRRDDDAVAYDAGDTELVLRRPSTVPRGGVHTHFAFSIPAAEYDDWWDQLDGELDLEEHVFGDARSLYCYDPDGNCVELGQTTVAGPGIDGVFEVVLEVEDLARAESFYTDLGFEPVDRGERGVGVRDRVLVLPSVICSRAVADRIADRVPGAVSAPHDHGCGQIAADAAQTRRAFLGIGTNPNVAGTVVVGLGCESIQSDDVAAALAERDVPVREVAIQDAGGTDACVEAGVEAAEDLRAADPPADPDLSDLTVGIVSGDLTDSTRGVADPLVGAFVDDLVDAGGRAVVAGSERVAAHPDAAAESAASEEVADSLRAVADRQRDRPARATRVSAAADEVDFTVATRAWGSGPLGDVLDYGERATEPGVSVVDAPSRLVTRSASGVASPAVRVDGWPVAVSVSSSLSLRRTYSE